MSVKVLYFASLKDRILRGEDNIDLPKTVGNVAELKDYLAMSDSLIKRAFEEMPRLRCAINQEMAQEYSEVKDGDEVAFFPPVTGG